MKEFHSFLSARIGGLKMKYFSTSKRREAAGKIMKSKTGEKVWIDENSGDIIAARDDPPESENLILLWDLWDRLNVSRYKRGYDREVQRNPGFARISWIEWFLMADNAFRIRWI